MRVHEVILVLADLYLSPSAADVPARDAAEGVECSHRMPGLGAVARYGRSQPCADWRQWVVGWLRGQQYLGSEGWQVPAAAQVSPAAQASVAASCASRAPGSPVSPQAVWFAT